MVTKTNHGLDSIAFERLAERIGEVFIPAANRKAQIFLCGASLKDPNSLRRLVADSFEDFRLSYQFELIYPEDIFDELLYSHQSKDLLSLENLLVRSVDAVVLIPESPGSYAELGAFTNNEQLRKKVICLIEQKYMKQKSFIMKGPVQLVKAFNKDRVVFINREKPETALQRLRSQVRSLWESRPPSNELSLLQIDGFLLPAIYLFEPVERDFLSSLVKAAVRDQANGDQMSATALSVLTNKKFVRVSGSSYSLTKYGFLHYLDLLRSHAERTEKRRVLDKLRLSILNWKLRGRKLKF